MLETGSELEAKADAVEAYVQSAFGVRLGLAPVTPINLPHFIADRYRLWQGTLLGQPMLLVAWKNWRPGMGFVADFQKHGELLRRQMGVKLVVLLLDRSTAAIRRQMVERRVAFVSPGNQLFIPDALLDLSERSTPAPTEAREQLTPTAQLAVLAALLRAPVEGANLTELADRLRVSVMSMSRAADELEAVQIARPRYIGRQRRLSFLFEGRDLWERAREMLQSPVRKVRRLRGALDDEVAPRAGESALSYYTMLASPRVQRRAIAAAEWKQVAREIAIEAATVFNDDIIEIETWSYHPCVLARDGVVDPLSLYLSVRDSPDERVTQAAEHLMETVGW